VVFVTVGDTRIDIAPVARFVVLGLPIMLRERGARRDVFFDEQLSV
jgi:hypothetical protein